MSSLVVGVLALQGAFEKHIKMIKALGVRATEIRKPQELADCNALIIPGGESTAILKQMQFIEFSEAFRQFAKSKPVFGTCAGLILMSDEIISDPLEPFHLIHVGVERNAFGRQIDSFETQIDFYPDSKIKSSQKLPAVFIRAPRITRLGDDVHVLACYNDEPVLVQQGHYLGATFHPELSDNKTVHLHFLQMIKNQ